MNGTIIFGVSLIAVALFTGGPWFLTLLIGGVVVAAYGAFAPSAKPPAATQKLPADGDPWV